MFSWEDSNLSVWRKWWKTSDYSHNNSEITITVKRSESSVDIKDNFEFLNQYKMRETFAEKKQEWWELENVCLCVERTPRRQQLDQEHLTTP